jgi:hypothetical protein
MVSASPVTTFSTPGGSPARCASSASASAVNGVCEAGFATTVQPAASAAPALRVSIAAGKFHGVINAATPDRLAQGEHAPVRPRRRHHVAVDAPRLFGEPLDEARRVVDFAARLGERLALLADHDRGEIVAVVEDQVEPAAQQLRAGFGRGGAPAGKGGLRRLDRASTSAPCSAARGRRLRIGRVADGEARAVGGVLPVAADQRLLAEQAGVGEFHDMQDSPVMGAGPAAIVRLPDLLSRFSLPDRPRPGCAA